MAQIASITLVQTDEARPIIEAILADNPQATAFNMPGVVKLDCEGKIIVRRVSVEERIGRAWNPQELQLVLVSMAGNVDEDDDEFSLSWNRS